MMDGHKIWRLFLLSCVLAPANSATAHPHVFVDGGVDFVMGAENTLKALRVTWRYDAFETLYILSSHGLELNEDGELDETTRQILVSLRSRFPVDFDGSAHLTVSGESVSLQWPADLDARMIGDRLEVTFMRPLETPLDVTQGSIEVAFYESTYFFAFSVTNAPQMHGPTSCSARIVPFKADQSDTALLATLEKLGREETSDIENVGALFSDRIVLECG